MSKRASIYLSEPLNELLLAHLARGEDSLRSVSALIGEAVDRYLEVVRKSVPDWSDAEWCLACDALNGTWIKQQAWMAAEMVVLELQDAVNVNGLDTKWAVDWPTFEAKLANLDLGAALAVFEVVERFWADHQRIGIDNIGALVRSVRSREPLWDEESESAGRATATRKPGALCPKPAT